MKSKNSQEPGSTENRAQLILIGGLVIAVAVVAIALVIGGGLFSQSTNDDGGLSSFTSETVDQIQAATTVGREDLEFVNENSTLYQGAYPDDICGTLVNATKVQQLVSTQLGEGESVVNVEVKQDCEELKNSTSWLTGQTEVAQLPSVNVSEPVETEGTKTCAVLHTETGYYDNPTTKNTAAQDEFEDELDSAGVSNPVTAAEKRDALERAENDLGFFDLDPIRNDAEVDLKDDYAADCFDVTILEGRPPADIVFAIDTTGSMDSSTRVTKAWQTASSGVYPQEGLTNTHRGGTGVPIPEDWIDVRGTTDWSGSAGDMVEYNNKIAQANTRTATNVCDGFFFFGSCFGTITDVWEIEYSDGTTDIVYETDLDNGEYRLDAPQRMWFTQVGLKNAVDDLNTTGPDRAGLIQYDTSQNEVSGIKGINDLSHRDKLKEETDKFFPNGGTDIAGAIQKSKDIIQRDYGNGPEASPNASKNIVLLTDGIHNPNNRGFSFCGRANAYDCSIDGNQNSYDDIFIHSVILGSGAADNLNPVSDMAEITNDPDPDLDKSNVVESSLPDRDDPRPNGTLIASDDPSDAEDIFETIIGNIEETTQKDGNASSDTDDDLEINATVTSSSGTVDEIYDARMNVSHFTNNGTYKLSFTDTDASGNEVVAWQMVVNNTLEGPPTPDIGYKVEFTSETHDDDSLNQTVEVNPSNTVNPPLANLSDPDEYVWLDLTGKGSKDRFDVGGLSQSDISTQLNNDTEDYMEEARNEVKDELPVAIVAEEQNPFGTANGTFSLEFEPVNGNFTRVGGIDGGGFDNDCSGGTGSLPAKCGLSDPGNDRGAVSTAQIKQAKIEVTVESPEGRSNRTIQIPPDGEYSYDIFE